MKPNKKWLKYDDNHILRESIEPAVLPLTKDEQLTIDEMISYIDASYNGDAEKLGIRPGVAIAANQMGLNKQIIYVHADSEGVEHKLLLANPKIISYSQGYSYLPGGEGCLSVLKEHRGIVKRRAKIIVEAKDLLNDNKSVKIIAEGLLSIILQHEIDHLSGILFYDRINKENPDYIDNDWIAVEK